MLLHSSNRSIRIFVAALICAFAWAIFIAGIDDRGVYQDERYSWELGSRDPLGLVRETATDVHPPLYYLWLHTWMRWVGSDNLLVIRLSAAIPALLAVAMPSPAIKGCFLSIPTDQKPINRAKYGHKVKQRLTVYGCQQ